MNRLTVALKEIPDDETSEQSPQMFEISYNDDFPLGTAIATAIA